MWAAVLLAQRTSVGVSFFEPVSLVAALVVFSLGIFDRWAWHWPIFRGWLVKRPDLRGTWEAELQSSWKDPQTALPIPPIAAFMVIHQTFSDLGIRLYTKESESRLRGAEILCNDDGTFDIVAVYQNEPYIAFRARSPIHQGALKLSVRGEHASSLDGHYWTDRGTQGSLVTQQRFARTVTSFEDGKRSFSAS